MQRIRMSLMTVALAMTSVGLYVGCSSGVAGQATTLRQQGSFEEAIALYEQVVAENPGTPAANKARLSIADIYRDNLNQPDQAYEAYEATASAAPTSDEGLTARYQMGLAHFGAEEFDQAARIFEAIVNDEPLSSQSADAQLMLAKTYERAGKLDEAQETYGAFSRLHEEDANALIAMETRARILDQLGKKSEAIQQRQQIVLNYGAKPEAAEVVQLARAGLSAEGASAPDPITESNRSDAAKRQERIDAVRERDRPRSSLQAAQEEADANVFGYSADEIMSSMQITADNQGTMYDAMFQLGNSMYMGDEYRQAGALYQRSIELAEQDVGSGWEYMGSAYKGLSDVYRKLGLTDTAKKVLRAAITKSSQILDQVIDSGLVDYGAGDYEKAIEIWSFIAGMNPSKDAQIYYNIGLAQKHLENTPKEVEAFERAVAANPRNMDAAQSLAEVLYYRAGQRQRAYLFQDIIEEKQGWKSYLEVGKLGIKYGYPLQAQQQFAIGARVAERAAELAAKSGDSKEQAEAEAAAVGLTALKPVATARRNDEQLETARAEVAALVTANPENALARFAAAILAAQAGDLENAAPEFQKAIELEPRNPEPVEALANLYIKRGNMDAAVGVYTSYLEKNPRDKRIQAIRDNLQAQASSAGVMQ